MELIFKWRKIYAKFGISFELYMFSLVNLAICHTMGISPWILREDLYYNTMNITTDSLHIYCLLVLNEYISYFCRRINSYNLTRLNVFAPIYCSGTSMVPPTHNDPFNLVSSKLIMATFGSLLHATFITNIYNVC